MGFYVIVFEDKYYGVCNVNMMMCIKLINMECIKIDGVEYFEFIFVVGVIIIFNLDLVKWDIFVYYIYDEVIFVGWVFWYMNYMDLGSIFDIVEEYVGVNIG